MPSGTRGTYELTETRRVQSGSMSRPWMVALFANPRYGWSCAGVLVNENTILTAAHCLMNTNANEIKAIIGVHTIWGKLNPLNYYSVRSIHRHPHFENCCKNDLAVIKLVKPVLYGPKINSVCLPFAPYASIGHNQELVNRTGVIIGWGDSSQDGLKNMIKSFTLQQGTSSSSTCFPSRSREMGGGEILSAVSVCLMSDFSRCSCIMHTH
jgi:hypothetical protein